MSKMYLYFLTMPLRRYEFRSLHCTVKKLAMSLLDTVQLGIFFFVIFDFFFEVFRKGGPNVQK